MLRCRKSSLLVSSHFLRAFSQAASRIGKIDSIWLMCSQNLVSNQIRIVELTRSSPKTKVLHTNCLLVDGTFEHKEHQCIFSRSQWTYLSAVVWTQDLFYQPVHYSSTCLVLAGRIFPFGTFWKHPELRHEEHVPKEFGFIYLDKFGFP